jgi:hypothetical protein
MALNSQQLFIQADVFARQVLLHRSSFDLKRFLGSYQEEWPRLLAEAYCYDRLKAIYYGINYPSLSEWPQGLVSFPGNILLSRVIAGKSFNFHTNDAQPFALFVSVGYETDVNKLFSDVFTFCPALKEGMSDNPNYISYVNSSSETILRGLFNASIYLKSKTGEVEDKEEDDNDSSNNTRRRKKKKKNNKVIGPGSLYEMFEFSTDKFESKMLPSEFPFMNSIMDEKFDKWYYYIPDSESGINAMHFNESLFLGRAIGLSTKNNHFDIAKNPMMFACYRDNISDPFTKEEVYAITGLKSELTPYSMDQISEYLRINIINKLNNGGNDEKPF